MQNRNIKIRIYVKYNRYKTYITCKYNCNNALIEFEDTM